MTIRKLAYCRHGCSSLVEKGTKECRGCGGGDPFPKPPYIMAAFAFLLACAAVWNFMGTPSTKGERLWWVGGSLHTSTGRDWRMASWDNKLATAADLVGDLYHDAYGSPYCKGERGLRHRARALCRCLDELTEGGSANGELIRDLAPIAWATTPDLRSR